MIEIDDSRIVDRDSDYTKECIRAINALYSLSKIERIAYQELKRRYKSVVKTNAYSPDFICDNKQRYEVKDYSYGELIFTKHQFKEFKPEDRIMIYKANKEGNIELGFVVLLSIRRQN